MKNVSHIFLSASIVLIIYIFYRDVIHNMNQMSHFYFEYYLLSTFLILASIATYFISVKKKIYLLKISFYTIVLMYICESALLLFERSDILLRAKTLENNLDKSDTFDKRSISQYFLEENIKPKDIYVSSTEFLKQNNPKILPLSLKSFTKKATSNREFGFYSHIETDRYGFINFDDEWNKEEIEILILGDSFLVPGKISQSISENLRKLIYEDDETKINKSILTLSIGGGGTLYQYAIAREYLLNKKVKNIILFYFELNDLTNLADELKNPILNKYLEEENFSQKLIYKQNIIDNMYDNNNLIKKRQHELFQRYVSNKSISQSMRTKYSFNLLNFFKLKKLRGIFFEVEPKKPIEKFEILMKNFKKLANKYNSNFYVVNVPSINRYQNDLNRSSNYYKDNLKIWNNLKIEVIDLNKELYLKQSNPLKLFPLESFGHTTINTNKQISEIVFEKIYNN